MNAQHQATLLIEWARERLHASGHTNCRLDNSAVFDAATQTAVCGCGVYTDTTTAPPASVPPAPPEARDPIAAALATINPTTHYTPADVEARILDVLARLETGAAYERDCIHAAYAADKAFTIAYHIALRDSECHTDLTRKADAMARCADLYEKQQDAEMLKKAAAATMHNLRAVLSGYQSTSSSLRAAYQAGGSPGSP